MKALTWSYSSLALYQQCPKKYYHLKVAKDIKEEPGEAMTFGNEIHKIAHEYVEQDKPIPQKYSNIEPALKSLKDMEGKKLCENKLGLTIDFKPCGFFDKNVWWRGIADIIIVQGDTILTVDYKTGTKSKYADLKQLEILALALFKHYPEVKRVKAGLLFLFADDFVKTVYSADSQAELWTGWISDVGQLETSVINNVWNAKPNFTCRGWCPVHSCDHNEGARNG
jgi:CRISPR/Cas system-associated exonuclease Cas4 (RecB family)